ncbi:MAG: EI24 domain-containing protein [Crocinitomicaceae bacterium]|nr:EI24 domain-containing protein [Crocinitomicaceae bacterium]
MEFINNFKTGISSYIEGTKFIFKNKLWYYFIFPAILSLGIFLLGQYFVSLEVDINEKLKANNPENLNELIWLNIELVISDGFYVIFTKFTKYIVIIILSPLLAMLSEKMEEIMTGNVYPFNFTQLVHDVRRGVRIAIRNMFWEYFFLVVVLGLAAFFPKNEFKAVMIFSIPLLIGFYYYGFGFLDYINERRRLDIRQSTYFVRNHRGLAMAIGAIYSILFMIPEVLKYFFPGVFSNTYVYMSFATIAVTFAPILAMAAATMSMQKIVGLENNEWAIKKDQVLGEKDSKEIETEQATETENLDTPSDSDENQE